MKLFNVIGIITTIAMLLLNSFAFAAEEDTNSGVSDAIITTKIKAKIALDKTISIFDVGIDTNQGVVTLSGTVNSKSEESALISLAKSTTGVNGVVISQLVVKKSEHPFKDAMTTAKVKAQFLKEKLFGEKDVSVTGVRVETNNGIVYLSGTVANKEQAADAALIARTVSGVMNVISRIEIANTAEPQAKTA